MFVPYLGGIEIVNKFRKINKLIKFVPYLGGIEISFFYFCVDDNNSLYRTLEELK